MSINMFPSLMRDNSPNNTHRNAVIVGKNFVAFAASPTLAEFAHVLFGKFRFVVSLANQARRFPTPALSHHISRIVFVRTEEKMLGVSTGRVITMMENIQAFGNWAYKNLIGDSMRCIVPALLCHLPIPMNSFVAVPAPTGIRVYRLNNFLKVRSFCGDTLRRICTDAGAVFTEGAVGPVKKLLPALVTNKPNPSWAIGGGIMITFLISLRYTHIVFPFTRRLGRTPDVTALRGFSVA